MSDDMEEANQSFLHRLGTDPSKWLQKVAGAIWDAVKNLRQINEKLGKLEKQNEALERDFAELQDKVLILIGAFSEIDKRLDADSKRIEAELALRISRELQQRISNAD